MLENNLKNTLSSLLSSLLLPSSSTPVVPTAQLRLLENNDYRLLENGDKRLLDGVRESVAPILTTPTVVNDSTLILTWTMSDDIDVFDYIVEYKASSSGTWIVLSDGVSASKTATITGLTASTSYDARVKAVNGVGESVYSNIQTISTMTIPMSIGNLLLWNDASDTATITSSSNLVSQINDKSGNNYHTTQATGSFQPQTGTQTINGLNALYLDTGNKTLNINSGVLNLGQSSNAVFIVYQRATSAGDTSFITLGNSLSFGSWKFALQIEGGFNNIRSVHNSTQDIKVFGIGAKNDANTHTLLSKFSVDSLTQIVSLDGSGTLQTISSGVNVTGTCALGQIGSSSTQVKIGEIIIYNKALTNAEMNKVGNYLNNKWGAGTWSNL